MADHHGYGYVGYGMQKRDPIFSGISPLPVNYSVTMLYVPMQTDTSMYDEMKALNCGTLFPILNKPFAGKCCK